MSRSKLHQFRNDAIMKLLRQLIADEGKTVKEAKEQAKAKYGLSKSQINRIIKATDVPPSNSCDCQKC